MNNYLLLDKHNNHEYDFIFKMLPSTTVLYPSKYGNNYLSWIDGCVKAVMKCRRNDILICVFDFQAVVCWWLSLLLLKKIKIVAINIMLKNKNTFRNKVVSSMYFYALQSNRVYATVTSKRYGEWLNRKLGLREDYYLLHDIYRDSYKCEEEISNQSVFCGGRNGRDWDFMFKVAKRMVDVHFTFVMPTNVYKKIDKKSEKNISILVDVPYSEFMRELCKSEMVCLPLDTEAPAGLIVIFQAAANNKMVITTDTVTTEEYIKENNGQLIKKDVQQWCNKIYYYLHNAEERNHKARNLHDYFMSECSETKFLEGLSNILRDVTYVW